MLLEKNQIIETTIEGIGVNGEGIAKMGGIPIFTPYTLPGERVRIRIVNVKKNYAYGKLVDVITPADERAREECPVYTKCGGCQLQHMKYKDQLAFKTVIVRDTFKKVANITFPISQTLKSEYKYAYRNKLQLPIGVDKKNNTPLVGFYANNSHRIVGINSCPLHPEWNEKLISVVKKFMAKYLIMGYNEEDGTGTVRHIVARQVGKILQIIIVINGDRLLHSDELVKMLCEAFANPSVFININTENTNVILGEKYIRLAGEAVLTHMDMGHMVVVSPESFMQVNDYVKSKIYNKAVEIADITENDIVVDAYCGIGILTAMFAERAKYAYGIEIVPSAIDNANYMVRQNMLSHKLSFIKGDCREELDTMLRNAKRLTSGNIILVLDPPRKGVEKEIIDTILKQQPSKIIYISCNPATLARDVGMLTGSINIDAYRTDAPLYELTYVQPYDMFPQTKHVETLVCLNRK